VQNIGADIEIDAQFHIIISTEAAA